MPASWLEKYVPVCISGPENFGWRIVYISKKYFKMVIVEFFFFSFLFLFWEVQLGG